MKVVELFLDNWKNLAYDYYMEQFEKYTELQANIKKACNDQGFESATISKSRKRFKDYNDYVSFKPLNFGRNQEMLGDEAATKYPEIYKALIVAEAFNDSKTASEKSILAQMNYLDFQVQLCNEHNKEVRETKEQFLNIMLDREADRKRDSLIAKITKKVGEIVDASNLVLGKNGDINGYIIGENSQAEVRTITAGGYNIQALHYRVLVK